MSSVYITCKFSGWGTVIFHFRNNYFTYTLCIVVGKDYYLTMNVNELLKWF